MSSVFVAFSQLPATQMSREIRAREASLRRVLPAHSETLASYITSLSESHGLVLRHPEHPSASLEELLASLPVTASTIVVGVSAMYRAAAAGAGRWPESWPGFIREASQWVSGSPGHGLSSAECRLYLGKSEGWANLWLVAPPCFLKHLLLDCSLLAEIDRLRYFQVSGPAIPKRVLSSYRPREPVLSQELTAKPLLYCKGFNRKFPLGQCNPLYASSVEACARELLANFETSDAVERFVARELQFLATAVREYRFTGELERLAPSKAAMARVKACSDSEAFRELAVISDCSVSPVAARNAVIFMLGDLFTNSLFGGEGNKRKFLANVEYLLCMNRHETVLEDVLWRGLSVEDFASRVLGSRRSVKDPGQLGIPEEAPRGMRWAELLQRIVRFVYAQVVVKLARFCFYGTEGDAGKTGACLLFFRKNVWKLLVQKAERGYVAFLGLQAVSAAEAAGKEADSSVRWIPKKRGMRPVMRQNKAVKARCKKLLALLNAVIRTPAATPAGPGTAASAGAAARASTSSVLGNSILHRDGGFWRLRDYVAAHAGAAQAAGDVRGCDGDAAGPGFWCFTADIRNCYESIGHGRLFARLEALEGQQRSFSFAMVCVSNPASGLPARWKTVAYAEGDAESLARQLRAGAGVGGGGGVTLVTPPDRKVSANWALTLGAGVSQIKQIVGNWSFQLESGRYRIGDSRGLVQGSSLASVLAAIYYGSIDGELPHRGESLVLRMVDDVLCVARSRTVIQDLADVIVEKSIFGDVNKDKCNGNFDPWKHDEKPVTWLGMELHPTTKKLNFQTIVSDLPAAAQVSCRIGSTETTLKHLYEASGCSQRHRLIPLLLNPACNDGAVTQKNAFKAGVICGARTAVTAIRFQRATGKIFPVRAAAKAVMRQRVLLKLSRELREHFFAGMKWRLRTAGFKFGKQSR